MLYKMKLGYIKWQELLIKFWSGPNNIIQKIQNYHAEKE